MSDETEVLAVLARYVRATDMRDGVAQGALFTDDAVVQILARTPSGDHEAVGEPLIGGAGVRHAVENYMAPHPEGGYSHHVTSDVLLEIDRDTAHLNAQFVVFQVQATIRPPNGWPADAHGAQGTLRPIESGYYDTHLARVDCRWLITRHHVLMDMPMAIPGI